MLKLLDSLLCCLVQHFFILFISCSISFPDVIRTCYLTSVCQALRNQTYTKSNQTKIPEGFTPLCRWSKLVRHETSALFGSEIRMERLHSIFCTNRHTIDIITFVLWL